MVDPVQGSPHDVLLAVALGVVMAGPSLLGDVGGMMMDLLGPTGELLLPILLLLLARFLLIEHVAGVYNALTGGSSYDSSHAVSLVLLLLGLLFYNHFFSSDGGDEDEELSTPPHYYYASCLF